MITQEFLDQLEAGMLKSYNRLVRKGLPSHDAGVPNFLKETTYRNDFVSAFMATFKEHEPRLQFEIERGGHANYEKLLQNINQMVENKLSSALYHKKADEADEYVIKKIIRELKVEVRSIFYTGYLKK